MYLRKFNKNNGEENNIEGEERENIRSQRRRGKIVLIVILFAITNIFSLYAGTAMALPWGAKVAVSKSEYAKLKDVEKVIATNQELDTAVKEYNGVLLFKKLFQVNELLHRYYYKDIDDEAMVEKATKAIAESLNDPYTIFMNKKEYESFSADTEGAYVGVGLQVGVKDDKITVIAPIEGSPAEKAGILTGDVIQKVNGTDVAGKDLDLAVSTMKGKEGETVTINIFRQDKGSFDVKITRAKITMISVKGEMLQNNIGLIELSMFDENTDEQFVKVVENLKKQGMKGLILDLRGNPGGLLSTCVNITSQFIEKGKVIVSTKDKYGNERSEKAIGGELLKGIPLVTLINGGTASASEILSGVIRDYKIGTLIGEKSFGKGVVQTVIETGEGTALKVTISKYYTPSGENIDKLGIKPDIEVVYPQELLKKTYNRATDPQFSKALEVIKDKMK